MLIGAGGLPILVHMIAFSSQMGTYSTSSKNVTNDAKQMVYMGIDCIIEVFAVKSSRTRDFCKLFVKFGLLPHLSLAFQSILGINSNLQTSSTSAGDNNNFEGNNIELIRWQYGLKIANIIWILSRYEITEAIYKDGLLLVIIQSLNYLILNNTIYNSRLLYEYNEMMYPNNNSNNNSTNSNSNNLLNNVSNNAIKEYNEIIEYLLKSIKNFTMEPTALNDLTYFINNIKQLKELNKK